MQETLAYAMEYYKELTSFSDSSMHKSKIFQTKQNVLKETKKVDEKFFSCFSQKT
jgi:hypothetical protein